MDSFYKIWLGVVGVFIGVSVLISACTNPHNVPSEHSNTGTPTQICLDFYAVTGNYILTGDGVSWLELEVRITDCNGNGYPALPVTFSATLGSLDPTSATTDEQGKARVIFTAGCIPGEAVVYAHSTGRAATTNITITGGPPQIVLSRGSYTHDISLYETGILFEATFLCAGTPAQGMILAFWCEYGCFVGGSEVYLETDQNGSATITWFPPAWGTEETLDEISHSAPRSHVITVTYMEAGKMTAYNDTVIVSLYPLQARLYLDGSQSFKEDYYKASTQAQIPVAVSVFYTIDDIRYPVSSIPVSFKAKNDWNSNASVDQVTVRTGNDGSARTYFRTGTQPGQATLSADIDFRSAGNCITQTDNNWQWSDHAVITIE
ncbi:Ig-like domain-containing protein [candidate division CSSED10-310 bacterium]|uniref:Ig-like domain-containing protein n=1 Tax=candidate division CSSED10-310 bacterium TaxID=2855610 RepID=A0ABV6Z580_UNCC1